jgi:hypothetical protein
LHRAILFAGGPRGGRLGQGREIGWKRQVDKQRSLSRGQTASCKPLVLLPSHVQLQKVGAALLPDGRCHVVVHLRQRNTQPQSGTGGGGKCDQQLVTLANGCAMENLRRRAQKRGRHQCDAETAGAAEGDVQTLNVIEEASLREQGY